MSATRRRCRMPVCGGTLNRRGGMAHPPLGQVTHGKAVGADPAARDLAVETGAASGRAGRQSALDRLSPPQRRDEAPSAGGAAELRALGRRQPRNTAGHVRAVLGARGGTLSGAGRADCVRAALRGAERAGLCGTAHGAIGADAGAVDRRLVAGAGLADLRRAVRQQHNQYLRVVRPARDDGSASDRGGPLGRSSARKGRR
jgi:hypothetical protein